MPRVNSFAKFFKASYPATGDVREGTSYGDPINVLSGTLVVDAGTPNFPGEQDVRESVRYGTQGSEQFTGNYRPADPADVREGVGYGGLNGSEFTGELVVQAGSFPSVNDVRLGIEFAGNPTLIGNLRSPEPENVRLGYQYDSNDSLTGTLYPGVAPDPTGKFIEVRCLVYHNSVPVNGAIVEATLLDRDSAFQMDEIVASTVVEVDETNEGLAILRLLRQSAFTKGDGKYSIEARHNRKVIWSILASMPDQDSVNLPELLIE